MKRRMRRVLELRLREAFVVVHCAVTDELDLRDTRDGLEVGMEDGLLRLPGFVVAMTVRLGGRVEGLSDERYCGVRKLSDE